MQLSLQQLSNKKVLIIDDSVDMRSLLQMSMINLQFEKVHLASSIQIALELIANNRYNIILCDYILGDSTDGQQFLEYLRANQVISSNTIFIMITAEQSYEKVVVASECAPDDYLLKPFSGAQFLSRLEKLLEHQEKFFAVDRAFDAKNWPLVVAECDKILLAKDRYFIDACKIKGSALLSAGRAREAAELYKSVIALRPIAWARLGLARAMLGMNDSDGAIIEARKLLADNSQFIAAYDFISETLAASGNKKEALELLEKAREISPGTMTRNRNMGKIANSIGRHDLAEQIIGQALTKHRFSPVREAHDYVLLSTAQTNLGKNDKALETLKAAKDTFRDNTSKVAIAATESIVHHRSGNFEKAQEVLQEALTAERKSLSSEILATIAEACFTLGNDDEASELLKHVIQNNPEDAVLRTRVHDAMSASGKDPEEAHAIIQASVQEVVQINNEGVSKAEAGELSEAIELLCSAADRLPDNMQITGNAAVVLALALVRIGPDPALFKECMRYRKILAGRDPKNPKLVQLDALLKQVKFQQPT